jgi:hypothetical protein
MEPTKRSLAILDSGNCEPLKATFHGVALVLAAVMGAYNIAAWVRRRQSHLAINATIYIAAVFWEREHVTHHLSDCFPSASPPAVEVEGRAFDSATEVKAA